MKKIKILYTIPNFKTAGSQYVLLSLFRNIDSRIFDPYLKVDHSSELIPSDIPENRQLVFSFSDKKLKSSFQFARILRKNKIDLVHSWDYKSNFYEALSCRLARVPYVYTKKNNAWSRRWKLKSFFSNHIAYDNPEMKDLFFDSVYLKNKITFVPHGVDLSLFSPLPRKPKSTFSLGCIANIEKNKNQAFIVRVLSLLPSHIVLHLYGNENKQYRKHLDRIIEKEKLENRVFFHGFTPNEKIPEVLNSLDIFILASGSEGMPVSILEAQACGIPVLSSDSGGGTRMLVPENQIFSLKNPEELKEKILRIYSMNPEEKKEIISRKLDDIRENYSLEKEVENYQEIYEELV